MMNLVAINSEDVKMANRFYFWSQKIFLMTLDPALCIFHCKVSGSQFLLYSDMRYVAYPEQSIISYYLWIYLCHIYLANCIIALSITASFILVHL